MFVKPFPYQPINKAKDGNGNDYGYKPDTTAPFQAEVRAKYITQKTYSQNDDNQIYYERNEIFHKSFYYNYVLPIERYPPKFLGIKILFTK